MNNPYAIESHYRSLLGAPAEVVSVSHPEGTLRILRFTNQPCEGAVTLATSGCGLFVVSGGHIRPECLIAVWGDSMDEDLSRLLVVAALDICNAWPDIEIGDCIGPAGPLHASTSMEALAIAEPAYFPDELALACADDDHTQVLWLIPLHSNEVAFIRDVGWADFELLLSELDPDLLDLQRPPIVIRLPEEA